MNYYYLFITAIVVIVLLIMCTVVALNETMQSRQRRGFLASFMLILIISMTELVTILIDGTPARYRWLNIASNFLGFALTPMVPLFVCFSFDVKRKTTVVLAAVAAYLVALTVTFPFGGVFFVDLSNRYSRGPLFPVYIAAYLLAILYLLWVSIQMTAKYQNRSRFVLYPIIAFVIFGTAVQVIWPQIHVSWLCVTLLSVLYYIYCSEMWHQVDGLTGLLSQKSYLNRIDTLNKAALLLVFDVDDFKRVNDNFGHQTGDQCLVGIADCIKKAFGKSGCCYRIGGDEFCVLISDLRNIERCYAEFLSYMEQARKALAVLPYVSVGIAEFAPGDDVLAVKEKADQNMYLYKRQRKAERNGAALCERDPACEQEPGGGSIE